MRRTSAADIEIALCQHLPAEQHGAAPTLAQTLVDAATGAVSPAEALARLTASPGLASTLRSLAGREIAAGSVLISFGAGSQLGDVTISGDVAGGSPETTRGAGSLRKWREITPAMAAGITDHVWSTEELLSFRLPANLLDGLASIEHLFPNPDVPIT